MREIRYLVVNSQNGETKLRKSPTGGFGEYCVKLILEWDDTNMPTLELKVPAPPMIVQGAEIKEYGIPWALAENILTIVSVSKKGQLEVDYTDDGLKHLYEACLTKWGAIEGNWWMLQDFAEKHWGLPRMFIAASRWEKVLESQQ